MKKNNSFSNFNFFFLFLFQTSQSFCWLATPLSAAARCNGWSARRAARPACPPCPTWRPRRAGSTCSPGPIRARLVTATAAIRSAWLVCRPSSFSAPTSPTAFRSACAATSTAATVACSAQRVAPASTTPPGRPTLSSARGAVTPIFHHSFPWTRRPSSWTAISWWIYPARSSWAAPA